MRPSHMCCSVLQCVAVCCSVLQCAAVCSHMWFIHTCEWVPCVDESFAYVIYPRVWISAMCGWVIHVCECMSYMNMALLHMRGSFIHIPLTFAYECHNTSTRVPWRIDMYTCVTWRKNVTHAILQKKKYLYMYMYIHIYIYIFTFLFLFCLKICIYRYIYIHIHIHIHTYM